MKLKYRHLFLMFLLLSSCQQEPATYSLSEARDFLDKRAESMDRGICYLGSDAQYHYFEIEREISRNVLFRIPRNAELFAPGDLMPYRSWFPKRRRINGELRRLGPM